MATEETASTIMHPSTADARLMAAVEKGDTDALYDAIRQKTELFNEIEETPLHKAAAYGHTEMVMELMVLQPTMARKLNPDGLSPMHIALKKGHAEIVLSLQELDKDLVRVRGKNGHTPFHYLFIYGKQGNSKGFLTKFLEKCPHDWIHDVTIRKETALHLAARKGDHKAFKILTYWLWGSNNSIHKIKGVLDAENRDGDTVLHVAASNNQPEILKVATGFSLINLRATNSKKLTALEIAESGENNKKCAAILRRAKLRHNFSFLLVLLLQLAGYLADKLRSMSSDSSNALLVVATLILTASYQSALSPPGGVFQTEAVKANTTKIAFLVHSNSGNETNDIFKKPSSAAGSSVLGTGSILWFFIPNIAAFCLSFVVTCATLIATLPAFFSAPLVASLWALLFCLMVSAVIIISPNSHCLTIMIEYVYLLLYVLSIVWGIIAVALLIKAIGKIVFNKQSKNANEKNSGSAC